MVSLVGFTTIFNKFKNNCSNIDYREMVKHSEKFIRSYNPDARKAHYIKGVANLPDAPTYDEIFDYVMKLGVDDRVGSHQGHLFYKGDSSAHLPIVNETGIAGFRFVHLIKFMIDDRIDDIFYINEPTSCVNRRCLNPEHADYSFVSEEEKDARIAKVKKRFEKRRNAEIWKNTPVVLNGEINLDKWKCVEAEDMTSDMRNASRMLCFTRKVTFVYKRQAVEMNKIHHKKKGGKIGDAYRCGHCSYWHITSHKFNKEETRRWIKNIHMVY